MVDKRVLTRSAVDAIVVRVKPIRINIIGVRLVLVSHVHEIIFLDDRQDLNNQTKNDKTVNDLLAGTIRTLVMGTLCAASVTVPSKSLKSPSTATS